MLVACLLLLSQLICHVYDCKIFCKSGINSGYNLILFLYQQSGSQTLATITKFFVWFFSFFSNICYKEVTRHSVSQIMYGHKTRLVLLLTWASTKNKVHKVLDQCGFESHLHHLIRDVACFPVTLNRPRCVGSGVEVADLILYVLSELHMGFMFNMVIFTYKFTSVPQNFFQIMPFSPFFFFFFFLRINFVIS